MRHLALCVSFLLFGSTLAQTPGVAGTNDYWITPGGTPGGSSCKPLTLVTPLTMNLNFSCAPGTPFVIVFATCPCVACWNLPPMGTSTCLPPPSSACPSSNQFLEVGVIAPCSLFFFPGVANAAGSATIPVFVPLAVNPFLLSTQTAFLGPATCVVPPWNLLFSQGWNLTFI